MKKAYVLVVCVLVGLISGCADMDIPGPSQIARNPIGNITVKIGMTKTQVMDVYGEPDFKDEVYSDQWGEKREEWFYKARVGILPVSAGYLGENLYLYFDGDSLTNISKKPVGNSVSVK